MKIVYYLLQWLRVISRLHEAADGRPGCCFGNIAAIVARGTIQTLFPAAFPGCQRFQCCGDRFHYSHLLAKKLNKGAKISATYQP